MPRTSPTSNLYGQTLQRKRKSMFKKVFIKAKACMQLCIYCIFGQFNCFVNWRVFNNKNYYFIEKSIFFFEISILFRYQTNLQKVKNPWQNSIALYNHQNNDINRYYHTNVTWLKRSKRPVADDLGKGVKELPVWMNESRCERRSSPYQLFPPQIWDAPNQTRTIRPWSALINS